VIGFVRGNDRATNSETRGCPNGALNQRGFIQGEKRLIRNERGFDGNFQQTSMESSEIAAVDRRSIRHRKMAAMMVMRGAVMIFTIIGIWMMVVVVMIMMLMGLSATFMVRMGIFMHHSRRHSCENAESEELLEEKCHVLR
jgi:hypothetical protein